MKAVIIYKSKTGFTKKYAQLIQEETGFDMFNYTELSKLTLTQYDLVIYGSRVHAGKIDGLESIKQIVGSDKSVSLVVFATGATPSAETNAINTVWKNNFTEDELNKTPHFYMQSGLNYEKMNLFDKLLMKLLSFVLKNKKDKDSTQSGTLDAITKSYDNSSKEYIKPLIDYLKTVK